MNRQFIRMKFCNIKIKKTKEGKTHQFIQMPDGTDIPGVVWTRVYDPSGSQEIPYVIAKIIVEL